MNEHLRLFPLFAQIDKQLLYEFMTFCHYLQLEKNYYLYRQGDFKQCMYFLCSGKVKIFKVDEKGRELIVSIKTKGEMFPHSGLFNESRYYTTNALVIEPVTIICVAMEKFEAFLNKYPKMFVTLLKMIEDKLNDLQLRLEDKLLNSTEEQVVNLLLRLSTHHAVTLSNDKLLFLTPFQIKDLANMIGLSRETMGRILAKLTLHNLIEKDKKGRLILNPLIREFNKR